jgi:hypothetical protein
VTLAVHPWFGEELSVVSVYGRQAVCAETAEGQLRLLPVAWTTLRPRAAPLVVGRRPVRLAPEGLRELALWLAARPHGFEAADAQKVGHFDKQMQNRYPDGLHHQREADGNRSSRLRLRAGECDGGDGTSATDVGDGQVPAPGAGTATAVVGEAGPTGARQRARAQGTRRGTR